MNHWQSIKESLAQSISAVAGTTISAADLLLPANEQAHLCLPCFKLSAQMKNSPTEVAVTLAAKLSTVDGWQVSVAGPYLNFNLLPTMAAQLAAAATDLQQRLATEPSSVGEVMIEYSNINTHKEYHLGHLRNIVYGDAVAKLYRAAGWRVWPVSYVNDFGIHVAKTIWQWSRHPATVTSAADRGYQLGQAYVQAVNALESQPAAKDEVAEIMREIESRQGRYYQMWQETRQWSLDYFAAVYQTLGIEFAEYYYESDYIEAGRHLLDQLLERGIVKRSEGAVIADLSAYDLGVLVLLRSDGTATYPVADLALASEKFRRHQLSKSIYVVDNRQSLYFKQLFKLLELMGYQAEMRHLAYDFVKLPDGMMSSRSGNTITFKELHDRLIDKIKVEMSERHSDWTEEFLLEMSKRLAVSVLKFEMLASGPDKVIVFDETAALRFDGFSAVYLQYAAARAASLLRKADAVPLTELPTEPSALDLEVALLRYDSVLAQALAEHNPSEVVKYLFELCRRFNDYYHAQIILQGEAEAVAKRLFLVKCFREILADGLSVLGIEIMDQL